MKCSTLLLPFPLHFKYSKTQYFYLMIEVFCNIPERELVKYFDFEDFINNQLFR